MKAHGLNPRIRKSPYFESSLKYGATEFHPYNDMWMPVGYDTPINEYWNTMEKTGIEIIQCRSRRPPGWHRVV
jgi:hypothetical protein